IILFSIFIRFEFKQSAVLFQDQRKSTENTFDKILELKSKSLETLAVDYTYWDEMVKYVKNPNETWAEQNLRTGIATFGADLLVVYNAKSFPVSYFASEGKEILYEQFKQKIDLAKIFEQKKVRNFFAYVAEGVIEIYGATIHPTDDPERKTEPQGCMFVIRLWDKEFIHEISDITDCQISLIYPPSKITLMNKIEHKEEAIQFSRILRGWDNDLVARVDVMRISPSLIEFKAMSRVEIVLIASFVIFIALIYIWFILRQVYGPLLLISRALKENKLEHISKMKSATNEFGEIARLIFKFSENEIQLAEEIKLLKTTESQLEKERDRVQEYLDIAGVMIMILDHKGNISLINKKGCQILGYEEPELIGRNWFENCLPKESKEEISRVFNSLLSGDESSYEYYENRVLRKDGTPRIIAFHNAILRNKESQLIGVLVSGEDITERKQAEKDLYDISAELRMIVDSSQSMIFYKDKENRFILVNKTFADICGLAREDIEGKTAFEIFPENAREYWQDDLEVIATGQKKLNILESLVTTRGQVWLRTDKIPYVDNQGNIIGIIGFALDVTEYKQSEEKLRESEERYRFLFNGSHDALMTLEPPDFKFTSANEATIKMFGVKDEAEFVTFFPWDLSPEIQPDGKASVVKAKEMLENALREGSFYFDWVYKRSDGSEFPCSVLLSVLFLGGKKIVQANVRDITEKKKIEEELNRKTEFLEAQKEASLDGLLVVDENRQKIMVNNRLIELFKIPQQIAEDKRDETLLQYVVSKTKDPQGFLDKVNYLYAHQDEKSRDEIEFSDGMVLDRYSSPVIDKNGKYFGRIWTFRDITELKQAEQELKKDLHDLEIFYKASIGREERILELKKRIKELELKLGSVKLTP
ncbi:MAG: PAS domain S-box protein, partial [Candidatus Omnitrophica bacterium]|nr:PAS domain S-box protein [Candidatus Omnitrophota bacterium]